MQIARSLPTITPSPFVRCFGGSRSAARVACQAKHHTGSRVIHNPHAPACGPAASYLVQQGPANTFRERLFMQNKTGEVTKEVYESTERIVADLQTKWKQTSDKPSVIALGFAAVLALWLLNGVASAVDTLPVFSGLFQLVGIFVTSWFTYRYLVFAPDREELKGNVDSFISKVQGK